MRLIKVTENVKIPRNVTVTANARSVRVTGPRGSLSRSFRHANIEMAMKDNNRRLEAVCWAASRKNAAVIRTVCAHIKNMIVGVTQGFRYKMRLVYAHFPINVAIVDGSKTLEIRNFMGEHIVRSVKMLDGVSIVRSDDVKDELVLEGNDIENVSTSAAQIHGKTLVKNKDIRKFLDGIYVSERGNIVQPVA